MACDCGEQLVRMQYKVKTVLYLHHRRFTIFRSEDAGSKIKYGQVNDGYKIGLVPYIFLVLLSGNYDGLRSREVRAFSGIVPV